MAEDQPEAPRSRRRSRREADDAAEEQTEQSSDAAEEEDKGAKDEEQDGGEDGGNRAAGIGETVVEELKNAMRDAAKEVLGPAARQATRSAVQYAVKKGPELVSKNVMPAVMKRGGPGGIAQQVVNTATRKRRSPADLSTPSLSVDEGRARQKDRGRKRSLLFMPMRWLRDKLSRAIGWVRAQIKSPVHLVKSLFMATIGKDRGFGFWWLLAMVAIALAIGLLVTVLLSPVLGILAALIVGIWMLVRRSRSSQSRKTDAGLATDSASPAATGG